MDEHLLLLFYLLSLLLLMCLTTKVIFPFFGPFWLSLSHFNDVFKRVDSVAHFGVELLLDSMHVEVHILTESGCESEGLLNACFEVQASVEF